LKRLEDSAATTQGVTPLSKAEESLKDLKVEDTSGINIDVSSVSTQTSAAIAGVSASLS